MYQCTSTNVHTSLPSNIERVPEAEKFSFSPISLTHVFNTLKHLHVSTRKATSDPELVPILRQHTAGLCESLAYLFNKSLEDTCYTRDWKLASVTTLYKGKGERSDPGNYRPMSLLKIVPRVFEQLVANAILALNVCLAQLHE